MSIRRRITSGCVALLSVAGFVVAVVTVAAAPAQAGPAPSAVTDVNPNSLTSGDLFGGRVVAFAVNPINPQLVFAASEFGGLWKSTNHGASWTHVDQVPLTAMQDVQIASSDTNLVIATGAYDGSTDNRGGGIWRSTDGGNTWAQASGSNLCFPIRRNNARKIAIAPGTPGNLTVLVGTDCGIARSTDSGASWSLINPPGNTQIWDVKVRAVAGNLQVDACGDGGFVRSNDGGLTWPTETDWTAATFPHPSVGSPPAPGNPGDPCRVATAPQDPNTIFMATRSPLANPGDGIGETYQFESDNGGVTWTNLNVSIDGNGRDPSAIVGPAFDGAPNHFEVWFMTDQMTMHQTCDINNTPRCGIGTGTNNACANNNSGSWSTYDVNIPHCGTDPGDLAIDPNTGCPFLESGDGGIFATSNGCVSQPTFTNANTGLHALWIYQVAATAVPGGSAVNGAPHTSVYYGMQDNGQVCSNDDAATFHNCGGADVFNTLADRDGPPSNVLKNQNGGFGLSAEDGTTGAGWSSPPANRLDAVAQFGFHSYAFITDDNPSTGTPTFQVQVTTDAGSTWTQMGPNLPGAPTANRIVASGPAATPTFYLELAVAGGPKIFRLSGPLNGSATLTQTAGSGITSPSTFAVDPSDPQRLYAVDTAGSGAAKFSTNGGASWTIDAELTNIVTRGGVYPFETAVGANISALAFDPNSDTVLAGTNFSGVYASTNNGTDWSFLRGSDQIPRVQSIAFDNRNPGTAYIGSQGRGLWRLTLPHVDLSITKTHAPDPVIAGTQLTWTLTVTNNGPDAAPDATVTDTLPTHDSYVTNNLNPPAGCSAAGQVVTCSLGDLDPGQSVTFKLVTFVDSDTVAAAGGPTSITNTARVSSAAVEDNPSDNQVQDTALVNDSADLSITKLCKPDTNILAGTPINCSIFVDNNGPSDARNVIIDDTILSGGAFTISNVAVAPGPTNCTTTTVTGGQKISCNVGDLAAASTTQTGRVTLTYTLTSNAGGDLDNTASVRSDTPDPDTSNNQVTVNLTVTAVADLALAKNVSTTGVAGTGITWTLSVHNNGPSDATNVSITDTVPAGVTINSVTLPGGSCTAGVPGDPLHPTVCGFGSLAAGATSATMTINATINPATTGVLHNDARVSSDTFDNNNANDLAHTDTTVSVVSSLSVSISATPNPATAGTPLSYKITVSNAGPSTATSVTLTDPLPAGVQFTSTGGVGVCGFQTNTNTVSCTLPDIDPGGSDVLFIYTTIKPSTLPGPMANSATATGTGSPSGTGNVSTNVVTSADLSIVLASDTNVYKPSTTIHYQITVTNAGPSDAQNVVITQALPAVKQGKYISNNIGCPPPAGTTLTCQAPAVPALATIAAGGSVTFQVNFFITGNKGTISSTATVTSATPDPATPNNTSTRVVTVK